MQDRKVFAFDNFISTQDKIAAIKKGQTVLQANLPEVKEAFALYNLLTPSVFFIQKQINAALIEKLALLRINTTKPDELKSILSSLLPKITPQGFVLIDNWHLASCRNTVLEVRNAFGISDELHTIDEHSIYWQQTKLSFANQDNNFSVETNDDKVDALAYSQVIAENDASLKSNDKELSLIANIPDSQLYKTLTQKYQDFGNSMCCQADASEISPNLDLLELYLYTLKQSLLDMFYNENTARLLYFANCGATNKPIKLEVLKYPNIILFDAINFIKERKQEGEDWFVLPHDKSPHGFINLRNFTDFAYTMIGSKRIDNIKYCLDCIRQENIPGDLMETGVCRGGAVIFMRGYLKAWNITDRKVWAADSFEGLPVPTHKEDTYWNMSKNRYPVLAIDLERVQNSFARYHLLDKQTVFLKGWFGDTLPNAPVEKIALLRLDGDLYESTMDALNACYHKVVSGGFIIVDDWGLEPCQKAVKDFRESHGITEEIIIIDSISVYWRKK